MPERTEPGTSSVAEYAALFQRLLPPGKAWMIQPGSRLAAWVDGLMVGAVRVHDMLVGTIAGMDPSAASGEYLAAWERSVGLPEPGEELAASTADRRLDVVARIAASSVRTEADWLALAEAAGYAGASVSQGSETMCTCDSLCTAYVQGEHMDAFSFTLNLPGGTPNAQFEALCWRIVQAGVYVFFDYS